MKKSLINFLIVLFFVSVASIAWAGPLVTLEWSPNSEPDLAGYNVYRSLEDGGSYILIGSKPAGMETFVDESVEFDTMYYWVVTAYDEDGNESGYSNQVSNMTGTPPPPDTTPPGTPQDINVNVHITIDR